ncbi:hypothetical protein LP419_33190 [Massilia sp. H-1]|nr:hypothetical protein LP419_33190 [Massilia sp. H-1]
MQTGTVRAKARFANDDQALFPSQFVNLRLELRTIKDAVMVPVTALRNSSTGDFVYVLNAADRTVAVRPVTRGQATVDKVQIKTGLEGGRTGDHGRCGPPQGWRACHAAGRQTADWRGRWPPWRAPQCRGRCTGGSGSRRRRPHRRHRQHRQHRQHRRRPPKANANAGAMAPAGERPRRQREGTEQQ